jgi:outer membrane protein assembly factor BamB
MLDLRHIGPINFSSLRLRIAAGALCVAAALGLAAFFYERHRTGSVFPHPHAPFLVGATERAPVPRAEVFSWPNYGYSKEHLRYFAAAATLGPPFRTAWSRAEGALLEFPPVIFGSRIFQLADDGVLAAIDTHSGKFDWTRKLGVLSASTPAVDGSTVFVTLLSRQTGVEAGEVVALNAATGATRWSRNLPSPSESSPLLDDGMVFLGSQDGIVYALSQRTGSTVWTYHAAGAVKASPTLDNGVLYFGDYAGDLQAVNEHNGRRLWRSGSEGALLGSGTFYSTAAVAYGRVFLGNTDGRIYAYDQRTGSLDWAVQTGAYVYASPAVSNAPGRGPTIFLGSYDGNFYAINARTGAIEWRYDAHGRISGSATIVGRIVYFADLGTDTVTGLDISTGHLVFDFREGSFDPVISDGHDIYLTGYNTLNALEPVSAARLAAEAKARSAARAATEARARRAAQLAAQAKAHKAAASERPTAASEKRVATVKAPARATRTSVKPPGP